MVVTIRTTNLTTAEVTDEVVDFVTANSIEEIETMLDMDADIDAEYYLDFPEAERLERKIIKTEEVVKMEKPIEPEVMKGVFENLMDKIAETVTKLDATAVAAVTVVKEAKVSFKNLITGGPEVYVGMLDLLEATRDKYAKKGKSIYTLKAMKAKIALKDAVDKLTDIVKEDKTLTEEDKKSFLSSVGIIVMNSIKKALKLVLGVALVGTDTITLLALASVRIVFRCGKVIVEESKGIATGVKKSVNTNVISQFKK